MLKNQSFRKILISNGFLMEADFTGFDLLCFEWDIIIAGSYVNFRVIGYPEHLALKIECHIPFYESKMLVIHHTLFYKRFEVSRN
jgi:hypothetical protein